MHYLARNIAPLTQDADVTRIPFPAEKAEASGWLSEEPRLYTLATPLDGAAGEVADHIVVSTASSFLGDSVVVVATDAEGVPFEAAPPLAVVIDTLDADAVLADLGYVDVTGA